MKSPLQVIRPVSKALGGFPVELAMAISGVSVCTVRSPRSTENGSRTDGATRKTMRTNPPSCLLVNDPKKASREGPRIYMTSTLSDAD